MERELAVRVDQGAGCHGMSPVVGNARGPDARRSELVTGELSHSDRRRSSKCRYLHLQAARRSQVLSGSVGTSAASKRKLASDRAASHAPSPATTSAPRYFSLRFQSNTTHYLVVSSRR